MNPVFDVNGEPHVVLRPAVEALGLDFEAEVADLRGRSWANCVDVTTVGLDGELGTEVVVHLATWLMLLLCIDSEQVAEHARLALVAYQIETANNVLRGHLGPATTALLRGVGL